MQREKELNAENAENAEKIKGLATKAQSHEEINNKKNLGVLVPLWQEKLKNSAGSAVKKMEFKLERSGENENQ